jgi:hypothetical protein
VFGRWLANEPLEDGLPLGVRPLWRAGETLVYLLSGTPILLGADPDRFLSLVGVGRDYALKPLGAWMRTGLMALDWVVMVAFAAGTIHLVVAYRSELARVLRLEGGTSAPVMLLLLSLAAMVGAYLLSSCAVDIYSIRYLVPLWSVLPGLLAAMATVSCGRWAARGAVVVLLLAWSAGQAGLFSRIGAPHPLRGLARALEERDIAIALAEPLDAHLLSFLTKQHPPVGEYRSFWPRLSHYRTCHPCQGPVSYVVDTADVDWALAWRRQGWPGSPPQETVRNLRPALHRAVTERPDHVLAREKLTDSYELWTLAEPLPDDGS